MFSTWDDFGHARADKIVEYHFKKGDISARIYVVINEMYLDIP